MKWNTFGLQVCRSFARQSKQTKFGEYETAKGDDSILKPHIPRLRPSFATQWEVFSLESKDFYLYPDL